MKPLNLSDDQRIGCRVTYDINRFEVYAADGWLMFAAYTKADLKEQLAQNAIKGVLLDGIAQHKYLYP